VLEVPVSVSVPVPVVVKEAKFPDAGIDDGIAVIEKVPLQVMVTSSPAIGAPTGDHTIEAYAMFAVIVTLFGTAQLSLTQKIVRSASINKLRKWLTRRDKPSASAKKNFDCTLRVGENT